MNKWFVNIERVENGFVVQWSDEDDEGVPTPKKNVFTFDDEDDFGEHRCTADMFLFVKEHFGVFNHKDDKKRLSIDVVDSFNDS